MNNICFLLFFSTLVLLCSADKDSDQNKFPLCKLCSCTFDSNDQHADVNCFNPLQYNIFQNYFWIHNGTNETAAYKSVTINHNEFINFTTAFPTSDLEYLNLANNAIFNISDNIFRNLQNMRVLILSYNDLENIHPHTFRGVYLEGRLLPLRNMRELRLDHNKLHGLNADVFEHVVDMEILDLSFNPLEVIDEHTVLAIDSLPSLKELYLQYTEIKALPTNLLHTPRKLQILDLSGNTEMEKIPETLGQAINLQTLYLNNTGFINLTYENGFPRMPSLRTLHLCRNEHLHHISRFAFGGLTNLTDLRLCDNIDLVVIEDLAFAKPSNVSGGAIWPPIKKLYIGNNKLAYLEGDLLARWDALSELDIRENPWTCECENQWLIDDLMPIYLKVNEEMAKQVMCAAPVEMKYFSFHDIYMKKSHMRCLDTLGNRPEKDGALLVGVLAGVLIAIPLILFILYAYQKRFFSVIGIFDKSPASYSRRFYKTTQNEDF